jgi:amino acid adenylation domain-containing protein
MDLQYTAPTQETAHTYPLSRGQKALWFLQQLDPASAAYNVARALRIRSPINLDAVRQTIQWAVDRQPALRTTFADSPNGPVHRVQPHLPALFQIEQAAGWTPDQLNQRITEETYRSFDLAHGPLLRAFVFYYSEDNAVLLLVTHHIICDLWSLALLINEMTLAYQAVLLGEEPRVLPLRTSFADYVRNQDEMLAGPEGDKLWAYWRERLMDAPTILDLPTDRPRPPTQTDRAASIIHILPEALRDQLNTLAEAHQTNLYTVVTTAFQVLLHCYTGQTDIVLGALRAGRSVRMAGLVGYFVNSIAHRTQLHADSTFTELLTHTHPDIEADLAHGAFPYSDLVERLQLGRDPSYSPLFQVMLAWQKTTRLVSNDALAALLFIEKTDEPVEINGVLLEPVPGQARTSLFDLMLHMVDFTDGLGAVLEYNVALFDEVTAARFLRHFEVLLTSIASNPNQRLSQFNLLSEDEEHQIIAANNAHHALAGLPLIPAQIEAQVAKNPDALAIQQGDVTFTYRQLNERANQLAHHLRALGVKPETLVGLCLPRSPEYIIGALAVWKAGGAYLALDPSYPTERLAFMLADSGAPVLLTHTHTAAQLPSAPAHVLCLDSATAPWEALPTTNLELLTQPQHLAYITYTSGSTGQPKGVMIEQGGALNFVTHYQRTYHINPTDRASHLAAPGFDATIGELWSTLTSGASVHIIPVEEMRYDSAMLQSWLLAQRITLVDVATAQAEGLISLAWPDNTSVRVMVTGGDVLRVAPATPLPFTLLNCYGPTEATVLITSRPVKPNDPRTALGVGRPFINSHVYVLDADRKRVPIGVPGDLYIGGPSVGRGYLNRPDLTAEKFVWVTGYGGAPERVYYTGDRGRWLADGAATGEADVELEFLGRADNQVKIRSFRVELGEIEAVLLAHPAVQAAAVLAHTVAGPHNTDKRLAAYIVVKQDAQPNTESLRAYLKSKLPDYMQPAAYTWLDSLPFTPSGKINRRALPAPEWGTEQTALVTPRTPTQEMLAGIWKDVLRIERLGIHDRFFDLGGHSLIATQVASRIREAFGIELPLRTLFEADTIHALAPRVEALRQQQAKINLPPIVPVSRDQALPLSFSQERMWFIHQLSPNSSAYNTPGLLRLKGALNTAALHTALAELVKRHESLRTTFPAVHGRPVQVVAPPGSFPFEQIDVGDESDGATREDSEKKLLQLLEEEAARPFDIANGPLARAKLYRHADDDHILFVSMHHIITDAWSSMVLQQDFAAIYNALVKGEAPALEPLRVQYADYAHWQRNYLAGEVLDAQMSYWRAQLAGVSPLNLRTDFPRPPVQTYRGSFCLAKIDDALLSEMNRVAASESASAFMVGLAAFYTLLYRYTAQADLAVGVPIANREFVQSEQLIGSLVNTLVMRADLSEDLTFRDLLSRVRETALNAYAHQGLPFAKLVAELNPTRDTSFSPLVQVMFNMINVPQPEIRVEGLQVEVVDVDRLAAQFDLTLTLADVPGYRNLSVEYNLDLFKPETMTRLLDHYQTLLRHAIAQPDQPIRTLPMLSDAEQKRVLMDWNATELALPDAPDLVSMIRTRAERTPHAQAVVACDTTLTYQALMAHVDALTLVLRSRGIGPDDRVGLGLNRTAHLAIAPLAVLAVGAAYVPLDPHFPVDRLAWMAADADLKLILTHTNLLHLWPADVPHLCMDDEAASQAASRAAAQAEATPLALDPTRLAYLLYTSGSTGRPKGVAVSQKSLVNFLLSMRQTPGLCDSDVLLSVTTLAFDIAGLELYLPLLCGATLVIATSEQAWDGNQLHELLARHAVTVLQATPATWHMLMTTRWESEAAQAPALKALCGGEALSADLARRLLPRVKALWNMYGPTETTIWSTCAQVTERDVESGTVTIGRPIANTQVYVLDDAHQPVPIGVAGELYIAGAGVAQGYWNRPDLTPERFVRDTFRPITHNDDARMYRTGDAAFWDAEGQLHFIGRRDFQVKLRGYRIELGEIESVLAQHPAVAQVTAVVHASGTGIDQARLVAYVVPASSEVDPDLFTTLAAHARTLLADYMVPTTWVKLDRMPLTPNGKVDRKALPVPNQPEVLAPYEAPVTSIEHTLADIWAAVLRTEQVSLNDHFFDLGGYSLLAVQLFAEIEKAFGVKLPLSTLFQSPTLRDLANVLQQKVPPTVTRPLVAIQTRGNNPPFFCVHTVGGSVFGYAALAQHLGADQPFYGLEAQPDEAQEPFRQRIETIAAQYVRAIHTVQPQGPYYLGGYSYGATLAYEMACQLTAAGHKVALLASFDQAAPKSDYYAFPKLSWKALKGFTQNLSFWFDDFRQVPLREQVGRVRRKLFLGALPPQGKGIDLSRYMDDVSLIPQDIHELMRTHLSAWERYQPNPYPDCVTVFRAQRQPLICSYDPNMAWDSLAQGGTEMLLLPGGHRNMLEEPHVRSLAAALRQALVRAHGRV